MKEIYFNGKYEIEKIKCSNNTVYLSDFIYKSSDGIEYNMIIKNKGYNGDWHIIELLSDNKLYATNNLWYTNNTNITAKIIETEISYSTIKEKYSDKDINYINSLNYVNECDIHKINIICEESITKYSIMEKKEEEEKLIKKFKRDNFIKYICSTNDNDLSTLKIVSYPRNMDINDKLYEVRSNTHSEYFSNIYEAQTEYLSWLSSTIDNIWNDYGSDCSNIKELNRIITKVDQNYINKKLLDEAYDYNIIFAKCKQLKNYPSNYSNTIYIIKNEQIEKFYRLYKCDFIDYNILNENCNLFKWRIKKYR